MPLFPVDPPGSDFDAGAAKAAGVHFIGYRREWDTRIDRLVDLIATRPSLPFDRSSFLL